MADTNIQVSKEARKLYRTLISIAADNKWRRKRGEPVVDGLTMIQRAMDQSALAERERVRTVFLPAILHGDEQHRAWLTAAVNAYIAGAPVPPPTGKGNTEARILAEREACAKVADAYARGPASQKVHGENLAVAIRKRQP